MVEGWIKSVFNFLNLVKYIVASLFVFQLLINNYADVYLTELIFLFKLSLISRVQDMIQYF